MHRTGRHLLAGDHIRRGAAAGARPAEAPALTGPIAAAAVSPALPAEAPLPLPLALTAPGLALATKVSALRLRGPEELPQAVGETLPIVFADGLVGDAVGDLVDARLQRRASLRRVVGMSLGLARPQHGGERSRRLDHIGHRLAAGRAQQVVGVLP